MPEGNVGGGTGDDLPTSLKGGIGTSSRVCDEGEPVVLSRGSRAGQLWQAGAAHRGGRACWCRDNDRRSAEAGLLGHPSLPKLVPPGAGSIIVVVATDAHSFPTSAPGLPNVPALALARVGGVADHSSGDLFVAFRHGQR